jgi:hypothetical protein
MTDLTGQGIFDYIRKLEHQEELGVMEARHYPYQIGFETIVPYAASITEARHRNGPSGCTGRGKMTSEAANQLFPHEWPRD